jgi:hypothetical protein
MKKVMVIAFCFLLTQLYADVDVLFVYDNDAGIELSGEGSTADEWELAMRAKATDAIVDANRGCANSGIESRFRVVGVEFSGVVIDYEANSQSLIETVQKNEHIRSLRNKHQADIVVFYAKSIHQNGKVLEGRAYNVGVPADKAYVAVTVTSLRKMYAVVHEMSHLIGCRHDIAHDKTPGRHHGYVNKSKDKNKAFQTIMGGSDSYKRELYFSDPNKYFRGVFIGNKDANNTYVMRYGMLQAELWNGHSVTNKRVQSFGAWAAAGSEKHVGDFNGDGKDDILLMKKGWRSMPIAFSNGDGTFNVTNKRGDYFLTWAFESPNVERFVGDFNGDGFDDVALLGKGWSGIALAISNGDGSFDTKYDGGGNVAQWAFTTPNVERFVGDFNGDGKSDFALLVKGWWGIPVALSKGDGTFINTYKNGGNVAKLCFLDSNTKRYAGDFNGDGKTDLALLGHDWEGIPIAFSKGNGEFINTYKKNSFLSKYLVPLASQAFVGDFNGDGKSDFSLLLEGLNSWGWIPMTHSKGNGDFEGRWNVGFYGDSVENSLGDTDVVKLLGDFTGDGKTNMALLEGRNAINLPILSFNINNNPGIPELGNYGVTKSYMGLYFGSWAATPNVSHLVGDFNGNGRDDIALVGGAGWRTIPLLRTAELTTFDK